MNKGWIKLHRQLLDCWIWRVNEPFDKRSAWVDLLLTANHSDTKLLFNGEIITITRGQILTSVRQLSAKWNWSVNRTYRFLKMLENENMVQKESNDNRTLLTIVNYSVFQFSENSNGNTNEHTNGNSTGNTDRTLTETPTETVTEHIQECKEYNNDKELKNDKNNITWRDDFEIYKEVLRQEYLKIITNEEFISEQERFHPNIDIKLSIEKSCVNYWATEAGWKKKKASRSKSIDWKATFTNAIGINKVYKPKYDRQPQKQESLYD